MKILGFAGSLRKDSYNRALLHEAAGLLPAGAEFEEAEFGDWALFSEDRETPLPEAVVALQQKIKAADGILLCTPEYNRSLPGAFKNMIDWVSRGEHEDCFRGKKVYIFGSSSGDRGANLAQYDLRRIMLYFGAQVMGTPELFLGQNKSKFAGGRLTDPAAQAQLQKAMAAFAAFVTR